MEIHDLVKNILNGCKRSIAKGITLVESRLESDRFLSDNLLNALIPYTGNALKVGISGIPGVGKSTFIENFGLMLLESDVKKKLAVLAVDPSSPINGGSILGDKTRMEELSNHHRAYIRPSPGGGALGGVTRRSRESILILEAGGFDTIFVETIGVGQSEALVASMVDVLLMIQMPNMGDDLQGMKKGVLDLANLILINKADGELLEAAKRAKLEHEFALSLTSENEWKRPVILVSSLNKVGLKLTWEKVEEFITFQKESGDFTNKRNRQLKSWLKDELGYQIEYAIEKNDHIHALFQTYEEQVQKKILSPTYAAKKFIETQLFSI